MVHLFAVHLAKPATQEEAMSTLWLDRNYTYRDWQKLQPHIGQMVIVEHKKYDQNGRPNDESHQGILGAVTDEHVTVDGKTIAFVNHYDGLVRGEIFEIWAAEEQIYKQDTSTLERPIPTDQDVRMAKMNHAAYVPSWCVRADGEH